MRGKTQDLIVAAIKRESTAVEGVPAFADEEIVELISKHFKKNQPLGSVSQARRRMCEKGDVVEFSKVGNTKLWTLAELIPKEEAVAEVRDEKVVQLNEFSIDDVVHTLDAIKLQLNELQDMFKVVSGEHNRMLIEIRQAVASLDSRSHTTNGRLDGITKILESLNTGQKGIIDRATTASVTLDKHLTTLVGMSDQIAHNTMNLEKKFLKVETAWADIMSKGDDVSVKTIDIYKAALKEGIMLQQEITLNNASHKLVDIIKQASHD